LPGSPIARGSTRLRPPRRPGRRDGNVILGATGVTGKLAVQAARHFGAGPAVSLPAAVLRSAGLEILGVGTGTMPPMDVITTMLSELLDLLSAGKLHVDIDRVPLSAVSDVWTRDQQGRRPVFIP
jgi:hypothetical protein